MNLFNRIIVSFSLLSSLAYADFDEMDETKAPAGMVVAQDLESGKSFLFSIDNADKKNEETKKEAAKMISKKLQGEDLEDPNAQSLEKNGLKQVSEFLVVEDAHDMDKTSSTRSWYWYTWGNWTTYTQWGLCHRNYFSYYRYNYMPIATPFYYTYRYRYYYYF